jgi:hypothetical protein
VTLDRLFQIVGIAGSLRSNVTDQEPRKRVAEVATAVGDWADRIRVPAWVAA